MLVRRTQVDVLGSAALDRYYLEEISHCSEFAPEISRIMGDEALGQYVRWAVDHARDCGFTLANNIRLFIETMFTLGSAFHSDPQYPWATSALSENGFHENTRAELLHSGVSDYLEATAGKDNSFLIAAIDRLTSRVPETFLGHPSTPDRQFIDAAHSVYPQKAAFVGSERLAQLASESAKECAGFNLNAAPSRFLVAFLMLFLGHGVCSDQLYPWIGSALRDASAPDEKSRVRRVYDKSLVYANAAKATLAGR